MVRGRLGIGLITSIIMLIGLVQSLIYLLSSYPDAMKDLMVNQELLSIQSLDQTSHPHSELGRAEMNKSSVTFTGVGFRLEYDGLHSILSQIESLSKLFNSSYAIFVFESPTDHIKDFITNWAAVSPGNRTIIIRTTQDQKLPREGRIAIARNIALDAYRNSNTTTDYLINLDMDVVGWDTGGVMDSFGQSMYWDVACSNGVILYGIYRDIYAFRATGINTNHHLAGDDHEKFNISLIQRSQNRQVIMVRNLIYSINHIEIRLNQVVLYCTCIMYINIAIKASHSRAHGRPG